MPLQRIKTEFIGIYYRYGKNRKLPNGEPDCCYDICYQRADGQQTYEKVGWVSEAIRWKMPSGLGQQSSPDPPSRAKLATRDIDSHRGGCLECLQERLAPQPEAGAGGPDHL